MKIELEEMKQKLLEKEKEKELLNQQLIEQSQNDINQQFQYFLKQEVQSRIVKIQQDQNIENQNKLNQLIHFYQEEQKSLEYLKEFKKSWEESLKNFEFNDLKIENKEQLDQYQEKIKKIQIFNKKAQEELENQRKIILEEKKKYEELQKENNNWKDTINNLKQDIDKNAEQISKVQLENNVVTHFEDCNAIFIKDLDQKIYVPNKNQIFRSKIEGKEYVKKIQILKESNQLSRFSIGLLMNQIITSFNKEDFLRYNKLQGQAIKIMQVDNSQNLIISIATFYEPMDRDLWDLLQDKNYKIKDEKQKFELKIEIAIKICEGMVKLQKNKICLCDLKPRNVLIKWDEQKLNIQIVLLSNFDDAQFLKTGLENPMMEDHKTGYSTRWANPEVVAFKKININSDLWSFGNILFYLFTSQKPYQDIQDQALQLHIKNSLWREVNNPVKYLDLSNSNKQQKDQVIFHFEIKKLLVDKIYVNNFNNRASFENILQELKIIQYKQE